MRLGALPFPKERSLFPSDFLTGYISGNGFAAARFRAQDAGITPPFKLTPEQAVGCRLIQVKVSPPQTWLIHGNHHECECAIVDNRDDAR